MCLRKRGPICKSKRRFLRGEGNVRCYDRNLSNQKKSNTFTTSSIQTIV